MRVIILSCVFPPEPVVSAKTSAEVASFLTSQGDDVTVVTSFPNRPSGNLYPGYNRRLWNRVNRTGRYETIRCFATLSSKSNLLNRFIENISFGITSGLAVLFAPKADVIYSNTWPIFATGIIYLIACLRKIPLVVSIQDIYPESLVAQKRVSPQSYLARCLRAIDRGIARRCRSVIVISDNFAETYRKSGLPSNNIHIVPNWGDPDNIVISSVAGKKLRKELNIPEQSFLCIYAGNIGSASGIETCIKAYKHLNLEKDIYLLIAGGGSQLMPSKSLASQINPDRIKFLSPWPASKTSAVLSAADCFLLPTQGRQSLASVPSKMISYLFAGKPIISGCLAQSETAYTIRESNCGIVVNPSDPEGLAEAIIRMRSMPLRDRERMGQSGKRFAVTFYSSNICLPRIESILRGIP